jgi:5-methylcytosine-specific restriction endonuclease McrA
VDVVEIFDRIEIFERDQWCCYLCGLPVDRAASAFDPLSPTVDHVIPLSQQGEHSRANTRCAHFGCNSAKQANAA